MAAPGEEDIFHHVRDVDYFHLPDGIHIWLPKFDIFGHEFYLTKFMVLQVVAGLFVLFVFRGLSRRIASGQAASGGWWNFWETLAVYIRDTVVRPTIGDGEHHGHEHHEQEHGHASGGHEPAHGAVGNAAAHPADKYLPYIWTCFFYILICNLLGAFPWMGSPTGNINVTGALAVVTIVAVTIYGSERSGFVGFWRSLVPGMDLAPAMKVVLVPLIWLIEAAGFFIRHCVLAVRLFANMLGGHTVIAVFMIFIAQAANSGLWYAVMPASVFAQLFVGALEVLFAFIQAYIFAFLATVFIAMAVHPH